MASDTKHKVMKATWEVGSTKEVVQALINTLVDPLLPSRIPNAPPSENDQLSVAKQMHAVVLLYNYYHRKHKPEQALLDYTSFCKLSVVVKPPLTAYMKLSMENESMELHCTDDQLSVTERAMKNACDIAAALDMSKDVPDIEGWSISKVAVVVIDSTKENCLLQFGSVTQGVWSPIEKELNDTCINLEILAGQKVGSKRKQSGQKASMGDDYFLQLACNAVKDAIGYDRSDLEVLETHHTYSLSKVKSATRVYMMQYTGSFSISKEVPLDFLVESLLEPLAKEVANGVWEITTPVVEYHHMLPYLDFILRWLSGGGLQISSLKDARSTVNCCKEEFNQSSMPDLCASEKDRNDVDRTDGNVCVMKTGGDDNSNKKIKLSQCGEETNPVNIFPSRAEDGSVTDRFDKQYDVPASPNNGSSRTPDNHCANLRAVRIGVKVMEKLNEKDNILESAIKEKSRICDEILGEDSGQCRKRSLSGPSAELRSMNDWLGSERLSEKINSEIRVYHHRRKNESSALNNADDRDDGGPLKADAVDCPNLYHHLCTDEKESGNGIDATVACNQDVPSPTGKQIVQYDANAIKVEGAEGISASEELQNALALLHRKRQELHSEICNREDALMVYEDYIARIRDDGDIGLARQCLNSILTGNNNWLLPEDKVEDNRKSKNESEIYLPGKSPCQDLEYICTKNNWRLPRYLTQPSYGKFSSRVVVKGKDFELSCEGSVESSPDQARESAASHVIAKMRRSLT